MILVILREGTKVKKFMRPCAIFLSVVMFLNMMDLGVFAETVQKVMDESNNPYYIADEDKIYDEELSSNQRDIFQHVPITSRKPVMPDSKGVPGFFAFWGSSRILMNPGASRCP